jgi:hypothetical protein
MLGVAALLVSSTATSGAAQAPALVTRSAQNPARVPDEARSGADLDTRVTAAGSWRQLVLRERFNRSWRDR